MKQISRSNNKDLALRQTKLIQALDGIGDVLVFETKRRNRNKNVIQGLRRIENIIKNFFAVQKQDPDKFQQLLLAQEFFQLYGKNDKEARLRLAFYPERYLVSFSAAINQILRIHDAAIAVKNDEISRFATYQLNWLLAELSHTPKNDLFVEQLLKKLADITRIAIEYQDRSMYAASFHWYIDIVFNKLRQKDGGFDLSYLGLFDKYFFSSVQYIISQGQTSLFEALVSSLVDGVHIPSYHRGMIWKYGHLILRSGLDRYRELDREYKIENRTKELADSENDLDTNKKLDEWLRKFDELKRVLEPNLGIQQREEAKKIEAETIDFATSQFKYNNLLEIVFAIGSYCLFKQESEYIRYLWEYKQPPDSDTSWMGHDIVPNTLGGVVSFYLRKGLFERKLDFWEGHHGSEPYYKRYFLLLLMRVLQNIRPTSEGKYEQIDNYDLPNLHIYRLSDLEHSIDNLVEVAGELKGQKGMLSALGFDSQNLEDLVDNKTIPFLTILKQRAQTRIQDLHKDQNISIEKVREFEEKVLKEFNESTVLRDILKHYKLYKDRTSEQYTGQLERFGTNIIDDKAAFFEEWHVYYSHWGSNYGRNLASSEDSFLFEKMAEGCREIDKNELKNKLSEIDDLLNLVILTTSGALYGFFEGSSDFSPQWRADVPQLSVKGFKGWYLFEEKRIPVFEAYHREIDKQILVLNRTKLGNLTQYSPLDEGEDKTLLKGIFYMNVQTFSENPDLMKRYLEKPPEWLGEIGDEQRQKEHLQERVLVHIFERFYYKKAEGFEGYLLRLRD